jgi:hypothetical protein
MVMNSTWQRLRGRTCDTCAFLDVFRSNGDGQVTRLHAFCRGPQSPHQDRPRAVGAHLWAWQKSDDQRRSPTVGIPT